jgi:uncharacterized OB-fold protein
VRTPGHAPHGARAAHDPGDPGSAGRRWFPDGAPCPAASAETAGWWEACLEHRLVVQRCSDCGQPRHPPGPLCPRCRSRRARWDELPGTGSVYTFTVVRQALMAALAGTVPYVVAAVEPDGAPGVRLVSNVVECDPADVAIGMAVEVVWEDMSPALALPRFRPATTGGPGRRP